MYEIARILGVTDTTYYNWLKRAATPVKSGESELRRLRRENAQLKRAVKSLAGLTGSDAGLPASETTHDRLSV